MMRGERASTYIDVVLSCRGEAKQSAKLSARLRVGHGTPTVINVGGKCDDAGDAVRISLGWSSL